MIAAHPSAAFSASLLLASMHDQHVYYANSPVFVISYPEMHELPALSEEPDDDSPRAKRRHFQEYLQHLRELRGETGPDIHRGKGRRLVVPGIKGARAREQRTRSRR